MINCDMECGVCWRSESSKEYWNGKLRTKGQTRFSWGLSVFIEREEMGREGNAKFLWLPLKSPREGRNETNFQLFQPIPGQGGNQIGLYHIEMSPNGQPSTGNKDIKFLEIELIAKNFYPLPATYIHVQVINKSLKYLKLQQLRLGWSTSRANSNG